MAVTLIYVPKVKGPILDKLSYVLDVEGAQDRESIKKVLEKLKDGAHCAFKYYKGYKYSYSFPNENGDPDSLTVQFEPNKPVTKSFIRVQYNPANVPAEYVAAYLDKIVPGGYKRIVNEGRVTRYDVAYDLFGVDINDLLIYPGGSSKSRVFYKGHRIETEYYGDRKSPLSFMVYDKGAQMKKSVPFSSELSRKINRWTRVEATLKPKKEKLLIKDLGSVENPFSKFTICQFQTFSSKNHIMKMAIEIARLSNVKRAAAFLTNYEKKKFRSLIKKNNSAWWNVNRTWPLWTNVVQKAIDCKKPQFNPIILNEF